MRWDADSEAVWSPALLHTPRVEQSPDRQHFCADTEFTGEATCKRVLGNRPSRLFQPLVCFLAHVLWPLVFLLSFLSLTDVVNEQVIIWSRLPDLAACSHLVLVIGMPLQDLPHSAGIWLQQASIWLLHHSPLLVGIPKVSLAKCVALSNPSLAFPPCLIPFILDCKY